MEYGKRETLKLERDGSEGVPGTDGTPWATQGVPGKLKVNNIYSNINNYQISFSFLNAYNLKFLYLRDKDGRRVEMEIKRGREELWKNGIKGGDLYRNMVVF